MKMLVSGARNQQHYPWATAARTVPTPHQSHNTELPAALSALLPVEGAQAPIKLLSGGASLNLVKDHSPLQSQEDSESCMRLPVSPLVQHLHYHTDK